VPDLRRSFRTSLAWRLCLAAEGRHDAMLTLRDAWDWDIAAGSLIAARAGCTVTDRHGAALRFNRPDPRAPGVIAAPPALHGQLLARLGA
jgi:myo-inositol-1(or 4)-monophosphatase